MTIQERIVRGMSCGEFFSRFCIASKRLRNEEGLSIAFPLSDGQRQYVSGKHIVCFYCGEQMGHVLAEQSADGVAWILGFLRDCFRRMRNIALWWFDDGSVMRVFSEYEASLMEGHLPNWRWPWDSLRAEDLRLDEDKVRSWKKRIAEARTVFLHTIEAMRQDQNIIYDDTGDRRQVLAWADAYYGDDSSLREAFQKEGKLSCRLDVTRLGDAYPAPRLQDWLAALAPAWSKAQRDFLEKSRQAERKILLCFLSREAVLCKGTAVLDDLAALLRAASSRRHTAVWWLADEDMDTLVSGMERSCAERYARMKQAFRSTPFALYDDHSKLEAALAECDAYYGTPAASAVECASKGRPVVWQECGQASPPFYWSARDCDGLSLNFIHGCWLGDAYYFAGWRQNGIFKVRRGCEKAEYVTHFPVPKGNWRHLFSAAFPYKSDLYFAPTNSHAIMAWNRETGTWRSFDLDSVYAWHDYVWFTDAFIVGENIWLKPCNYGAVVRFHLPTGAISYCAGWEKEIRAAGPDESGLYIGAAVLAGNNMWMAARGSGYLVCFSTENETSRVYAVPEAGNGVASLAHDGKYLWIYAKTGNVLRWDAECGVTLRLPHILPGCEQLGGLVCHSGALWAFANWQDAYACYDLASETLTYREHYLPEPLRQGIGCAQLSKDEHYIYITPNFGALTVRFDPGTRTAKTWAVKLSHEDETRLAKDSFCDVHEPMGTSAFYSMYEVALFLERGGDHRKRRFSQKPVGRRIYDSVIDRRDL